MDSTKEPISVPEYTFPDDGGRPIIRKSSSPPKFRPNDQVLFYNTKRKEWTGPYLVCYHENRQYKLGNEQQQEVNGGKLVEEAVLKLFDPFE
ncbi:hypothetical protein J3E69DRAFT_272018 [Trichoderma sp. SZMC 28015]